MHKTTRHHWRGHPRGRRRCPRRSSGRSSILRGIWPFYYAMFAVLVLVTYIPALSLGLPGLMR